MRLGDVTFDAEGGEKGVEWAGGGGFDHSILIRFKRFIQNPFALSLSKGRSCLEGRKKTVLRQAQHERMRGQFSIWKVSTAFAVSRSINASPSSAAGVHTPPAPSFARTAIPVSASHSTP